MNASTLASWGWVAWLGESTLRTSCFAVFASSSTSLQRCFTFSRLQKRTAQLTREVDGVQEILTIQCIIWGGGGGGGNTLPQVQNTARGEVNLQQHLLQYTAKDHLVVVTV